MTQYLSIPIYTKLVTPLGPQSHARVIFMRTRGHGMHVQLDNPVLAF